MEAEVRPSIRARDREEKFAGDELRKLGELGCCCMLIPESWGGLGADTISYVLMLEEVARVDAAMAVALSVTNSLAVLPVYKYGTEAAEAKIFVEPGARRNPGRLLPHRAASRVRRRRDRRCPRTRHDEHIPPERNKILGHKRRRGRPLHRVCKNRSGGRHKGRDAHFSSNLHFPVFVWRGTRIRWVCALRARRKSRSPIAKSRKRIAWAKKARA